MKNISKGMIALIFVLCASVMVLGSLLIATAESGIGSLVVRQTETSTLALTITSLSTLTPADPETLATDTLGPSPTSDQDMKTCIIPNGWIPVIVGKNDTLDSLANKYGTTAKKIKNANCLDSNKIHKNDIIFVPKQKSTSTSPPPLPPATQPIVCYKPYGWINYVIRSGDTLNSIAKLYSTSANKLQSANCIYNPNYLRAGDILWVPNNPTITPTNTPKNTSTPKP